MIATTQTTDTLLMVRPGQFRKNEETAIDNYFQEDVGGRHLAISATREFDHFVTTLTDFGLNTLVLQDDGHLDTPDSIFPNNTISFHKRTAVIYPMFAQNRRRERQLNPLGALASWGLIYDDIIDYSKHEEQNIFLEGTGCLILDRINRIAYCSLSARAHAPLIHQFCLDLGYEAFIFQANQTVGNLRKPIYHTNVMMAIGTHFAQICLDSIDNVLERDKLIHRLETSGKTILPISEDQMNHFAGNILEVCSTSGSPGIVMSSQAYRSLNRSQIDQLESFGTIIHSPLDTIEAAGGGSARCMIAEVFY